MDRAYRNPGPVRERREAGIEVDPWGSTEANAGIERGIPSVNIGRTFGIQKHSLEEEADIEGLFTAQKQLVLLLASLG